MTDSPPNPRTEGCLPARTPACRLARRMAVTWIVLTLAGTFVHQLAWTEGAAEFLRALGLEGIVKSLSNADQVATAPAWAVAFRVLGRFQSVGASLLANAGGWALWVGFVWAVLAWRRERRAGDGTRSETTAADPAAAAPIVSVPAATTAPSNPARRRFLFDGALATSALGLTSVAGAASCVNPWSLRVCRYSIPIRGLPSKLDGFRIVQITDTHLGPRIPADFIRRAVDTSLALKPDLFALTGDYAHMGVSQIDPAAELFRPLTASGSGAIATIGVLGNHDHYADAGQVMRTFGGIGVVMLDNDRVFIDATSRKLSRERPVSGTECLCIAGLGDLMMGVVDPGRALDDVHPDVPRIVLAHHPDTAEEPVIAWGPGGRGPNRIDLMLSGHTHGGQVRLPFIGCPAVPSRFGQKYAHGLVQGPKFPVVVSAGVGMSIFPARWGVDPEIVEITLVRA